MKKASLFIAFALIANWCMASTSITTSNVSGHWTLAGSPYLIFNNITVPADSSLSIDPGVEVIFQGSYRLNVNGILYAVGTPAANINFHIQDTTNFLTDNNSDSGGWHGIQYQQYMASIPDTSAFSYCNVSYVKLDSADWYVLPEINALYLNRKISVTHCNFFNNRSVKNALPLLWARSMNYTISIDSCKFFNNTVFGQIFMISSATGTGSSGGIKMTNNEFYNDSASSIVYAATINLLLEGNDFHNNNGVVINIFGNHAIVKHNKIHDNINLKDAALCCWGGFVDIIDNLICNNKHISGACGAVDGGGGINISHNSSVPYDSTFYTVRNNIIANNYSPFEGGGIKIFYARALIANNDIINNSASGSGGAAIYFLDSCSLIVKNNIFWGNSLTTATSATSPVFAGISLGATLTYEHNWTEHIFSFDKGFAGSFTLVGDTTTNYMGTTPNLDSPTLTPSVTESALYANFSLLSTSVCINHGDSSGADCDSTDYVGGARIMGGTVDIGAIEYLSEVSSVVKTESINIKMFPNPASGNVNIIFPEPNGTLIIRDITGKVVFSNSSPDDKMLINTGNMCKGLYLVEWHSEGVVRHIQKLIVE